MRGYFAQEGGSTSSSGASTGDSSGGEAGDLLLLLVDQGNGHRGAIVQRRAPGSGGGKVKRQTLLNVSSVDGGVKSAMLSFSTVATKLDNLSHVLVWSDCEA